MTSRLFVRSLFRLGSSTRQCSNIVAWSTKANTSISLLRSVNYGRPFIACCSSRFHTSTRSNNEHIINIQDAADFTARVTKNSTPVIIDFHATWCGPCKLLGPRLESLISSKNGKVILAKIDIDEMTELAVTHGVQAVPTVIAMKDGKVIDKFVGLKDDADLETFIQKLIN